MLLAAVSEASGHMSRFPVLFRGMRLAPFHAMFIIPEL